MKIITAVLVTLFLSFPVFAMSMFGGSDGFRTASYPAYAFIWDGGKAVAVPLSDMQRAELADFVYPGGDGPDDDDDEDDE